MNEQESTLRGKVRESHGKGLARPVVPSRNLQQVYDTLLVLALAERIEEKEIRLLGMATDLRERGLESARNEDLIEGINLIAEAREIYRSANLSKEAFDCAETFQTAAESYVQYKLQDYAAAVASMTHSLKLCESLANTYGYPFEMRRVHLARNIARIQAFAGNTSYALGVSANLLQYIAGKEEAWPLPYSGQERRHLLEDDAAVFILDQVLAEVLRLLEPQVSATAENLSIIIQARRLFMSGPVKFQQADRCLSACISHVENDTVASLTAAAAFFETGPQSLEFAWREMEKKFLLINTTSGL